MGSPQSGYQIASTAGRSLRSRRRLWRLRPAGLKSDQPPASGAVATDSTGTASTGASKAMNSTQASPVSQ